MGYLRVALHMWGVDDDAGSVRALAVGGSVSGSKIFLLSGSHNGSGT